MKKKIKLYFNINTKMSNYKRIVLDFGHGGVNTRGEYTTAPAKMFKFPNGDIAYEGVINRWLGEKVVMELKEQIPELSRVMTVHYTDYNDVPLANRAALVNSFNSSETLFVSIHCNAANSKARGFEIFTTKGVTESDTLAECIADEVETLYNKLGLKLRFDTSDGDKDKESDFYVLRKTKCPAVLIETLFFDNYEDYCFLRNLVFQEDFAKAVVRGIKNFLIVTSKPIKG